MDTYTASYVKVHVHVDAGQRVWCKNEQLEVHVLNGVKKVQLPSDAGTKLLFTFEDLKIAGARVDVPTVKSLALMGAEGRWRENIDHRRKIGLPSNVYVANARSIEYAQKKNKPIPDVRYVGRVKDQITETFDNVDDVVDALGENKFRTEFSRGRRAKKVRQGPG